MCFMIFIVMYSSGLIYKCKVEEKHGKAASFAVGALSAVLSPNTTHHAPVKVANHL